MIIFHTHLMYFQGGSKMILELSKKFVKKETITLVINDGKEEYIQLFKKEGIKVVNLKTLSTNNLIYWFVLPAFLLYEYLNIKNRIHFKNERILTTTFPSHILGFLFSRTEKINYFTYCFEPFPFFYSNQFIWGNGLIKGSLFSVLKVLYSWLDRMTIRHARQIFTLNTTTQKAIQKIYRKNSLITYMGVDSQHFRPTRNKEIQKKYSNYSVIIHSTDYSFMKRTDLVLKIFSYVIREVPKARLLITSTRPYSKDKKIYQNLAKKLNIEKSVVFLDFVNYKILPAYYTLAKCYLSCSYDELLGASSSNLPVKEAQACGTPAARANITTEDVIDGKTGYLINPLNIVESSKKVIKILRFSTTKRMHMSRLARKKIKTIYTWKTTAEIMLRNMN